MDFKSFTQAIQQIADEKGISRESIVDTIEMALAAAYKRDYGKKGQIVRVKIDPKTGDFSIKQIKIVVDESMVRLEEEEEGVIEQGEGLASTSSPMEEDIEGEEGEKKVRFNPEKHMMLEEARVIKPDVQLGDELEFSLEYHDTFGRIAAQTAKQVIIQRIRETERETIFNEFKDREGELISGIIQRIEGKNVYIDLGRTMGILPFEEQVAHDRYRIGERIKTLIILVEKNPKGPGVFLSRSHPRLLKKLFEVEVPEIAAESVEIKAIVKCR